MAVAPLLVVVRGRSARAGASLGFAFGVGFFGTLLAWISLVGWAAWGALVLLQAPFLAAFGACAARVSRLRSASGRVGATAAAWIAVEFARSLFPVGGFTWGQLAQSQHDVGWILAAAQIGGGWTVAVIVVGANALVAEAVAARGRRGVVHALVAAALLGAPALVPRARAAGRAVDVAIVQGNVPRDVEDPVAKELEIVRSHRALTEGLAGAGLDLVVWPESAVGLDIRRVPEAADALASAARAVGAPIIAGGNLDVGDDHYRVMAFHVSAGGEVVDRYQKTHRVPFGEYVPARRLLGWLPLLDQVPRDALAGSEATLFDVAGGKVAPVISFEGDFGSLVRSRIAGGGRLLVVATNTSTWGTSWASAQHLAFSQVRAAENGVWVVHAAISGISGIVAPDGTVVATIPLWRAGTLSYRVRFATATTLYARTGDWLPWAAVGATLAAVMAGRRETTP